MSADTGASHPVGVGSEFPRAFYTIIQAIDRFSDITGRIIALTMLFLVVTITYEVVMRYGFNAPTVWVYEASFMANGAAFMLGCDMRSTRARMFAPISTGRIFRNAPRGSST